MKRDKDYEDWLEKNKSVLIQTFVDLYCPDFDLWARQQFIDQENERIDQTQ